LGCFAANEEQEISMGTHDACTVFARNTLLSVRTKNAQTVIQTFDVRFLGVDVCVELWYNIIKTRDFLDK
jgi:hypothetical protein